MCTAMTGRQIYSIIYLLFASIVYTGVSSDKRHLRNDFVVGVALSGRYDVVVNGKIWLNSQSTFFYASGKRFTLEDGSLVIAKVDETTGRDKLGQWKDVQFHFRAGTIPIIGTVKSYLNIPMAIFEQHFPNGVNGTSLGDPNAVLSGFPHFKIGGQEPLLGYLNYGGMMVGDTTKWMGRWTSTTLNLRDGIPGGPLALFDKKENVLIISSFNQFMAGSSQHHGLIGGSMSWGIMGSVKRLPENFNYKTVVFYGNRGINQAFDDWGKVLRTEYNKDYSYVNSDFAVNYLGYWTDNGSYYYYNPEKNHTFEDTILDVQKYARSERIPYRYVQYDSWWYFEGPLMGVTKWEGRPDIFPHGMPYVYQKTGWPVVAHNRWWSGITPYAKQNGGKFNFIVDVLKSLPMDQDFWDFLFKMSKQWGLITYEQDWMTVVLLALEELKEDVTLGRGWLMLMGNAAAKNDLTLQYCMANPRHALQSLEIPVVTQARVSDDYSPGKDNWKIGVTSIFAHALGLAPYKDTFWTTEAQPGNPYKLKELYPALHTVVSTLGTGPVGPGDAIGRTNVSLLMRCCNADGLILKPDKPATAVDGQIIQSAFRDGSGPTGEVWSTYSVISDLRFGIILAAAMAETFSLSPATAGLPYKGKSVVFGDNPLNPNKPAKFDNQHPLVLKNCTNTNFCLYYTTPVLSLNGTEILLYGEIEKWVPMSKRRVTSITIATDDIIILLSGAVKEHIVFWLLVDDSAMSISCILSESGTATLSVSKRLCNSL